MIPPTRGSNTLVTKRRKKQLQIREVRRWYLTHHLNIGTLPAGGRAVWGREGSLGEVSAAKYILSTEYYIGLDISVYGFYTLK